MERKFRINVSRIFLLMNISLQFTFNLVIVIYAVFYFIERYSALEIFA